MFFRQLQSRKEVMRKAVVLYTRVSTGKAEADTTENQLNELRKWAEDNDFTIIGEFKDLKSGRGMEDREGLNKALEIAHTIGCPIAIVELSRLSRSIADIANMINSGQIFHFTRSGNEMTKEMILFAGLLAEMESSSISRRVSAGIQNKFQRNPEARKLWGAGSRKEEAVVQMVKGKKAKADKFALKYGAMIVSLQEQGNSLRTIASMLMSMEIRTANGRSKWSKDQVRNLVLRYEGLISSMH